jgi:hypothetical protein
MRIRTVKPSFMRHEELQDLEVQNPNMYIMLTFQGLWMLCDSKGRFEFKPRSIKLDVLPYIPYDNVKTLEILIENGFIITYEVDKKKYGFIPTFTEHQRISGKELTEGEKYPPIPEQTKLTPGSDREATEKQPVAQEEEGKGLEEKEGNGSTTRTCEKPDFEESFKFFKESRNKRVLVELHHLSEYEVESFFKRFFDEKIDIGELNNKSPGEIVKHFSMWLPKVKDKITSKPTDHPDIPDVPDDKIYSLLSVEKKKEARDKWKIQGHYLVTDGKKSDQGWYLKNGTKATPN